MNKYGNRTVRADGFTFDSQAEHRRYQALRLMERAGIIKDLDVHRRFLLHAGIRYECDFSYIEDGKLVAEDVKGVETAVFRLKKKLFLVDFPQWELRVIPAKDV